MTCHNRCNSRRQFAIQLLFHLIRRRQRWRLSAVLGVDGFPGSIHEAALKPCQHITTAADHVAIACRRSTAAIVHPDRPLLFIEHLDRHSLHMRPDTVPASTQTGFFYAIQSIRTWFLSMQLIMRATSCFFLSSTRESCIICNASIIITFYIRISFIILLTDTCSHVSSVIMVKHSPAW